MFQLEYTKTFIKDLKRLKYKDKITAERVNNTLKKLISDPTHPGLKSHTVGENEHGNIWSSRVTGDIRVLWPYSSEQTLVIILLKVGGHDYVY